MKAYFDGGFLLGSEVMKDFYNCSHCGALNEVKGGNAYSINCHQCRRNVFGFSGSIHGDNDLEDVSDIKKSDNHLIRVSNDLRTSYKLILLLLFLNFIVLCLVFIGK
mgnify:CR=1 FL=1